MQDKSRVILPKKFWDEAADKQELKRLIGHYLSVAYPGYEVIEIGKYYAICQIPHQ